MKALHHVIDSPVGPLELVVDDLGVRAIHFVTSRAVTADRVTEGDPPEHDVLQRLVTQLHDYFAGTRQQFDLPLLPERGTPFQRAVWKALQSIPYGETWSYSELAAKVGRPAAVRAVGQANGANPLPIVVPCHRVIGRDGTLTGFGGGVEVKRLLLSIEGCWMEEMGLLGEVGGG